MLDSQKSSGPWEVEEDVTFGEIAVRRRRGSGPPVTNGPTAGVFEAEYAHIRSFGVTDTERLSAYFGLKVTTFEQRIHRAAA
ncbi:hypothetical protein [Nocardia sp. NPDC127526]|uniref:hypothetical protein n=1 Tax=Nocardia sp. NPDC127526 TaxID=3345393 RepID=UPI00363E18AE